MAALKTGLKKSVVLFALLFIILPIFILGYLFISYHDRTTINDINNENMRLAAAVRSDVNNFLQAPLRTVNAIVKLIADPAIAPHIDDVIAGIAGSHGFVESILVLDRDGFVRHLGMGAGNGLDRRDYLGFDLSTFEHIARARQSRRHVWSDISISPITAEPTLSLAVPFKGGAVVANLNISSLASVVMLPLPASRDRVYLVSSTGRIIAHPDRSSVLRQSNVSSLPVVAAGLAGREGVYGYEVNGVAFLGAVMKIPETGWLVVVERDKNEVLAPLRTMTRVLFLVTASSLALVVFFVGYVNSRIVRPVAAISAATRNAAVGSFTEVPAYAGRYRELDELTGNFNAMIAALHEREGTLRERTRDLEREAEDRLRLEAARRLSEERFQTIFDSVNDAIIIHDPDTGSLLDVNRKMTDMFGYTREEARLITVGDISSGEPPYTQQDAVAWIRSASAGQPQLFEWRHRDKGGNLFWSEVNMRLAAIGGRNCVLTVVRDITRRKIVEAQLHESEQRYRMLFESAGDAILLMQAGLFVDCNRKTLEMFGCSWEQVLGQPLYRFSPGFQPDGRASKEMALEKISEALAGGSLSFEWKHLKYDGTPFDAEVSLNKIELPSEVYIQAIVRDISERKRTEEQLYNIAKGVSSETGMPFFRSLVEHLAKALGVDFAFVGEVSGKPAARIRIIAGNDAGTIAENTEYDLPGTPCENVFHGGFTLIPHGVRELFPRDNRIARLGIEGCAAIGLFDSSSHPIGLLSVQHRRPLKDVSGIESLLKIFASRATAELERSKAEQERELLIGELQEFVHIVSVSRKEWLDTFDSITDMICIHDSNFTIIKANRAYASYLGMEPSKVIQKKCHDQFPHVTSSPLLGCSPRKTGDEARPVSEEVVDAKTGRTFHVSTYPFFSPVGDQIGSIHIARDTTEEKETELQLIMSERLASLGLMASGIAHELNNPLESVMISVESLLMRADKGQYDQTIFKKYLQIIDDEVLRCREITSNMLSFARRTSVDRGTVDVQPVIDSALKLIGYQGRLKQVDVKKAYQGRPLIRGNEGELRQVIVALVINALDAMGNRGTLTIETGTQADNAYVKISDTGPGISPENLSKLFSPFFTTKAATGGTGLGLAIAQKIITSHQGSIQVSSEQGSGAIFTITLPCVLQQLP